jgi:glycosyltransferase involved in cell wall biosynthesis
MLKLSIITINYNNRTGLKKTIESVINQSFRDFEYLIIDGGSTDGSKDEIIKVAHKLAFYVSEPDKGIYNAMNKGISKAIGEYCLFLNSGDCLSSPDILRNAFSVNFTEDIVYGETIYGNMVQTYPEKISLSYMISKSLPHQSTFIKRSLFTQIGLYNEKNRSISDWEFCLKAVHLYDCSYKSLSGMSISRLELPGDSQNIKNKQRITEETINTFKTCIIPILEKKLADSKEQDQIIEIFERLFKIHDSKLVRLALKLEDSAFFYLLRKIYYKLNRF